MVKIDATKSRNSVRGRSLAGKILATHKIRTTAATIIMMNPTTARPAEELGQPVQKSPVPTIVHWDVANEMTQNNPEIAVITAVMIRRIVSLICIGSSLFSWQEREMPYVNRVFLNCSDNNGNCRSWRGKENCLSFNSFTEKRMIDLETAYSLCVCDNR